MKKNRELSHKLTEISMGILVSIFIVIVIGGIGYGIHYLTKDKNHAKVATQTSQRSNSNSQRHTSTSISKQSSGSSNNGLANTGPGDNELAIFAVASVGGTLISYIWRIKKLASSRQ